MIRSAKIRTCDEVQECLLVDKSAESASWAGLFGVIVCKRITWRLHIEMMKSKTFRKFLRVYSLFKSGRLSDNIKLTVHREVTRSVMTYACPICEFALDTYLLQFQRLQNKVPRTTGNFPRRTLLSNFRMYTIIQQNCEGNKQSSCKIMRLTMFAA
jgi:hypothetical protein